MASLLRACACAGQPCQLTWRPQHLLAVLCRLHRRLCRGRCSLLLHCEARLCRIVQCAAPWHQACCIYLVWASCTAGQVSYRFSLACVRCWICSTCISWGLAGRWPMARLCIAGYLSLRLLLLLWLTVCSACAGQLAWCGGCSLAGWLGLPLSRPYGQREQSGCRRRDAVCPGLPRGALSCCRLCALSPVSHGRLCRRARRVVHQALRVVMSDIRAAWVPAQPVCVSE